MTDITPLQRLAAFPGMVGSTSIQPLSEEESAPSGILRDDLLEHVRKGVVERSKSTDTGGAPLVNTASERNLTLELDLLFVGKKTFDFLARLEIDRIVEEDAVVDDSASYCRFQVKKYTTTSDMEEERLNEAKNTFEAIENLDVEDTFSVSGTIANLRIINRGSGYTTSSTITFSRGEGSGAAARITAITNNGGIKNIEITNRGSGYRFPPSISINDGSGASIVATIHDITNTPVDYVKSRINEQEDIESSVKFHDTSDVNPSFRTYKENPKYRTTEMDLDTIRREVVGRLSNYDESYAIDRDTEKIAAEHYIQSKLNKMERSGESEFSIITIDSDNVHAVKWHIDLLSTGQSPAATTTYVRWRTNRGENPQTINFPQNWLVSTITTPRWIRDFRLRRPTASGLVNITVHARAAPRGGLNRTEPFFIESVEQDAEWMLIYGNVSIDIGGPDHDGTGAVRDATNPYSWTPQTSAQAALGTLMDGLANGSIDKIRLQIRDKIIPDFNPFSEKVFSY